LDFLKRSDDFASEAYLTKMIVILALSQDIFANLAPGFQTNAAPPWKTRGQISMHGTDVAV